MPNKSDTGTPCANHGKKNPGGHRNESRMDISVENMEVSQYYSEHALDIIAKYCHDYNMESIQDAYLMSAYAFDRYLESGLERGEMFEN